MNREQEQEMERFCAHAHPRLVAAFAHHFGDRWLAEELAQEALVRACDRWARVRRLDSPTGWAFRVGANLGTSRLRQRAAERRARARHGPSVTAHRDADAADRLAVTEALKALSEQQRETVVLRYYLGLSARQVAETVGSTEGAVRVATHRAITRLREMLGDEVVADEPEESTDVP